MQNSRFSWHVLPRYVALLAILASPSPPLSASKLGDPAERFSPHTYRAQDGLPIHLIYALAQDLDGYLWIGGPGGLARFDGMQFVMWGAHGEPPLPYGEVRSLLADREG